jgi:hypothetical protein
VLPAEESLCSAYDKQHTVEDYDSTDNLQVMWIITEEIWRIHVYEFWHYLDKYFQDVVKIIEN